MHTQKSLPTNRKKAYLSLKAAQVAVTHRVAVQCVTWVVVIKRHYRIVDFKRDKKNIEATVKTIEYDPNRTAFIALVEYTDGEKRYILAPQGLQVGAKISSGDAVAPEIGNALQLKNMPLGTIIHNLEMQPGQGGKLVRSAGSSAQLTSTKKINTQF